MNWLFEALDKSDYAFFGLMTVMFFWTVLSQPSVASWLSKRTRR